jgi:hypothetical protein
MKKPLGCLALLCCVLSADEDGFRERFADPATREAALAELTPGTRDAYFHTALVHQLAGRDAEFWKTLHQWHVAATRKESPESDDGLALLENRQKLIGYTKNPGESLTYLTRRFDLKFDDTRPDAAGAESLPTRLDPALISAEAFEKATAAQSNDAPYKHYQMDRLIREIDDAATFDETKARWFLQKITRADLPGMLVLIDRSLSFREPVTFGSLPIHTDLTAEQLRTLWKKHPALGSNESFNLTLLGHLKPGAETRLDRDRQALAEHLKQCRDHVIQLPPAMNTLKAHILFHHLRIQQQLGNHPKDDFLAYLALPRSLHPILLVRKDAAPKHPVSLSADYESASACPPVRDDAALLESYLEHFLASSETAADFTPFVEEKSLRRIHARARLLAGADPQRWGESLDPAQFMALQEETRISFAPGAPDRLKQDAAADLTLDLKNTPELLVRIYQLDQAGHLARHGDEPEVGIDLDGLVPHHERRITYAQAPIVHHRENIALPELSGAGLWLVEFVSKQVSARALVRKGWITPFIERTATGQIVRVFDENNLTIPTAVLTLGDETFRADAAGRIVVPNAANDPATSGIVTAGNLAATVSLESRKDALNLGARFHLDREQLLADQEARLHLRVRLGNHGHEIPLDRIKDPALVLHAKLLGGITTERVIAENLKLEPVMEIPFQVPADLLELTLSLHGTVTPATGGDPQKLSSEGVFQINGDLQESRVATAYFSPTAEGHRLEVRGRNGEALASRAVTLTCRHRDFSPVITVQTRTDAKGRIDLGQLENISQLTASGTDIAETEYQPDARALAYTNRLHIPQGAEIRLPLRSTSAVPTRAGLSLMETLEQKPVRDHFDKISIENGQVVIRNLPPGDFRFMQQDLTTWILVSGGAAKDGLLVSNTRILPLHEPFSPMIASKRVENDRIRIRLAGHGPDTRVSLVGKRHHQKLFNHTRTLLPFSPPVEGSLAPGFTGCAFLTEKRLDDEMRYILDRRAAKTYPGSMLPRPGLLLNRWTEEDVTQEKQSGSDGLGGSGSGLDAAASGFGGIPSAMRKRNTGVSSSSTCDFLAKPAVLRIDLTPDADGLIDLPMADFKDCQFIEIVAADAFANDAAVLPLPANDTPLRDRRIARPLDPKGHHQATRSAAVLAKGAEAQIENLLDADWRAFTTLEEAHQFLFGMNPDDRLREFAFLTDWPDFKEAKKLELLSTHACHEFHLFLARKDKAFFEKHVKPLLARKAEPAFIDDLLLGRDLKDYLRPYAWQRLNAAEKALLAQGLPAARDRIARELSRRWELEAPSPDAETTLFTQTLRGTDLATQDSLGLARNGPSRLDDIIFCDPSGSGVDASGANGASYITEKLRRIVIPKIDFEDTTVEEAINFLRMRSMELDSLELDPSKKGMNFVVRRPRSNPLGDGAADPSAFKIKELRLNNVPLNVALKYICDATKLRYKVDDFAITLVPQTETGEDLYTRTFRVPPDFLQALQGSGNDANDPFAEPSKQGGKRIEARKPIKELLKNAGISFPEGSSVALAANGTLMVTNSPSELDKVEQLTATNESGSPEDKANAEILPGIDDIPDPFAEPAGGATKRLEARKPVAPRQFPDRTRLWRESNYYKHAGRTDESLIPLNRFWIDLATWDGKAAFLSAHFNACHTSASEALMCLALLDLPFKAGRPEVTVDGSSLRVKAREPMLLFYKDTRRTDKVAKESPLLIRQTFSPLAEKFLTVGGRQVENPVSGDFRPGVPYCASLIVTNPTGVGRRIDVLAQIPAGSIPLEGKPATLSSTHEVEPHGVLMLELAFYFPAPGDFAVYPLHVTEDGVVQARTPPRTLKVSATPAPQDSASWLVLAATGSGEEVLKRLRSDNLKTLDLAAIRWRLMDRAFFFKVAETLKDRLFFSPAVDSFGFRHTDVDSIRRYLENSGFVRELGPWLDSPLLEVRPRTHHDWQTLEFDPLVNARAHRFGDGPRMTHDAARAHYHAFLDQLAWKPKLDASDQLTLTAFFFLQDRIGEALVRFAKIDPAKLSGRLHYDYLHCVALFYQENPGEAAAIAAKVLPTLPPGLWSDRFQAVKDQAAEIAALSKPEKEKDAPDAGTTPQLDLFAAPDGRLALRHRGLEKAELRLFNVDIEVMFSKNPFLENGGDNNGEPAIRPNKIIEVPLRKDAAETFVELPESLRHGSLLVSARAGSAKRLKVLDSGAIEVLRNPADRSVRVLDAATRKPLPKTYVKVYVETRDGSVSFHKDGYTDLRGMFDYLSHTGIDPSTIKRSAILISHPEKGARTMVCE